MCPEPHCFCVALHHCSEVVPPLAGRPPFPVRKGLVRLDVENLGAQVRCGSRPASGVGCRSGLSRQDDERVCPGEVQDPYPPPFLLVVVEQPDPHVDEFPRGMLSWGEERLGLPHTEVRRPMSEEGRRKAPVAADALEIRSEGVYQVL